MLTLTEALPSDLTTEQVVDEIFADPNVKYGLTEFADLGRPIHEVIDSFPITVTDGRNAGETQYYVTCRKREKPVLVLSRTKSYPEEIIRQLWLYKLTNIYRYPIDAIRVEHSVTFGTSVASKAADILVYAKDGRTPKIVIEVKRPNREDGLAQLKSYLNAEGSPVGVWTNGQSQVILYRPYPRDFDDTLNTIPDVDETPEDVLKRPLTLSRLESEYDFKGVIEDLEELILANAGVDEFNEIFKLIFAKLYDEIEATGRPDEVVHFRKSEDVEETFSRIAQLLENAKRKWPGIFGEGDELRLTPEHLSVVVGHIERKRLLGANIRIMDDAFEYLLPEVAKKKNGQFFTPRYVIDMCMKMLNPHRQEYLIDPACGSAGFLVHAMEYVWPAKSEEQKLQRSTDYAARFLWGLDFDERAAKVSHALMLIAGDGKSHVYRVNALDPREWFTHQEGIDLQTALRGEGLLANMPPRRKRLARDEAWTYFSEMKFDIIAVGSRGERNSDFGQHSSGGSEAQRLAGACVQLQGDSVQFSL